MSEEIEQIKNCATKLRRLTSGAGGQSCTLQHKNYLKSMLGKNILKLIEDYEQEYKEFIGKGII